MLCSPPFGVVYIKGHNCTGCIFMKGFLTYKNVLITDSLVVDCSFLADCSFLVRSWVQSVVEYTWL